MNPGGSLIILYYTILLAHDICFTDEILKEIIHLLDWQGLGNWVMSREGRAWEQCTLLVLVDEMMDLYSPVPKSEFAQNFLLSPAPEWNPSISSHYFPNCQHAICLLIPNQCLSKKWSWVKTVCIVPFNWSSGVCEKINVFILKAILCWDCGSFAAESILDDSPKVWTVQYFWRAIWLHVSKISVNILGNTTSRNMSQRRKCLYVPFKRLFNGINIFNWKKQD